MVAFEKMHGRQPISQKRACHNGVNSKITQLWLFSFDYILDGKKIPLKVLSRLDEKRSCTVYKPKFHEIPPFTPPRTPQNQPTVNIFNRPYLRYRQKRYPESFIQIGWKTKELYCLQAKIPRNSTFYTSQDTTVMLLNRLYLR